MPADNPTGLSSTTFLSVGILSVDHHRRYGPRRAEQRFAWVDDAHSLAPAVYCRFILRCGTFRMNPLYPAVNYTLSSAVLEENATHGDLICTPAPVDAGKLKGPSLSVVAWFEHVLQERPESRYIATADDDAYLHIGDLLHLVQTIPAQTHVYVGAMMGWSFHAPTYRFRNFGWTGCDGCSGPFPFAVGSFMGLSTPLARAVVDGTRDELLRVYALPPNHTVFYQDAFIGSAIHRLSGVRERIGVYDLDALYVDTDGFRVAPSLIVWHNRHKMGCRVQCLGEYYQKHHCSARFGVNYTWARSPWYKNRAVNQPNFSQYDMWQISGYRRPSTVGVGVALSGRDARVNGSCMTSVDLRAFSTMRELNLTSCLACITRAHEEAAQSKAEARNRTLQLRFSQVASAKARGG